MKFQQRQTVILLTRDGKPQMAGRSSPRWMSSKHYIAVLHYLTDTLPAELIGSILEGRLVTLQQVEVR